MQREFTLRQQPSPNPDCLQYPFYFIFNRWYDTTPLQLIGEPDEERIDFPNCVTHYYWIHEGINDEVPWRALFRYVDSRLNNKERYGFYIGECDNSGFDCRGDMRIYVSDNMNTLIQKALTDADYRLYIEETIIIL